MILPGSKIRPAYLAPLAGWSDSIFRQLCLDAGASFCFTEMVSAEGISRDGYKSKQLLAFAETERPHIGVQLFGANPDSMAKAVAIVNERQAPLLIDLNFGCPVKKVVSKGSGAAILNDFDLLKKMACAAVKASDVPVTAKIRSGWDRDDAVKIALLLQDQGIAALTLHPRTRMQGYGVKADWNIVARVKQAVQIPVIGNGDINTPQDAKTILEETGCDRVMIGRAAMGNPWLFSRINHYLESGKEVTQPRPQEILKTCLEHLLQAVEYYGEEKALKTMRKFIIAYLRELSGAAEMRKLIFSQQKFTEIEKIFLQKIVEFNE